MDNGDLMEFGPLVQRLVVAAYALDNDSVIILHPPMVAKTVKEKKLLNVNVTEKLVLVRKQQICHAGCIYNYLYSE